MVWKLYACHMLSWVRRKCQSIYSGPCNLSPYLIFILLISSTIINIRAFKLCMYQYKPVHFCDTLGRKIVHVFRQNLAQPRVFGLTRFTASKGVSLAASLPPQEPRYFPSRKLSSGFIFYSDNPATVTVFWSQKGSSFMENHRMEWQLLSVTLFRFPSTVTVTDRSSTSRMFAALFACGIKRKEIIK